MSHLKANLFRCLICLLGFLSTHAMATCRDRIAIVPPELRDPILNSYLAQKIEKYYVSLNPQDCTTVIHYDKSVDTFYMVGASAYFSLNPNQFSAAKLRRLKEDIGATHLLFISMSSPKQQKITLTVYRIKPDFSLTQTESFSITLQPDEVRAQTTPDWLRNLGVLVVNSIGFGTSSTQVFYSIDERYKEESTKLNGTLPPIISSISFSKVSHPFNFALFDYSLSLFPSFFFFAINQDTKLTLGNPADSANGLPQDVTLHVESSGACSSLDGEFAVHSIIGTTSLVLGIGPCLKQTLTDNARRQLNLDYAHHIGLGHRVFITDQIFMFLSAEIMAFRRKIHQSEYAQSNAISRGTFGFGWFIPDAESIFLKTWHRSFD